jgi:hypothetical protein
MDKSDQINELAFGLSQFQGEMKAVAFDATNPFFRSKYATLSALVDNASKLLTKYGLAVSQLPYAEGGVYTILMHKSGQWIGMGVKLNPTKNDPQGVGSAITYARRYAYAAVLGLVSEADDDGNAASQPVAQAIQKVASAPVVKPFVYPKSSSRTIEGILMSSKTKTGTSQAGKQYTVTEYVIKDGHNDLIISCFGSKIDAEDWSEVVCKGVTEKTFKGNIQLLCESIEKKALPTEPEDVKWEE